MDPVAIIADMTEMETRPPLQPEKVAALEARGFRVLGRFATLSGPSRGDNAYDKAQRARLETWRDRPAATVLVAPDGSAFAGVDTFGDAPLLRLRTELDDDGIVETIGIVREGALMPRRGDPFATLTGASTDDHPIRLIETADPDLLIATHRDHVTEVSGRRGAAPIAHADRDHALRLASRALDHMNRVRDRGLQLLRRTATVVAVLLGGLLMAYQLASGVRLTTALLFDLFLIPVGLLVFVAVAIPIIRSPRWRPSLLDDR